MSPRHSWSSQMGPAVTQHENVFSSTLQGSNWQSQVDKLLWQSGM